jgi:RNA-directed DNA polymerase
MKRQTSDGLPEQLGFGWDERGRVGHGSGSEAVSGAAGQGVEQVTTAEESTRALKQDLREKVAEEANLIEALRRGCANKGSAGVEGRDVTELKAWMRVRAHREKLRDKLISGEDEPAPVRGVPIPKPGGKGMRPWGIPTVSS